MLLLATAAFAQARLPGNTLQDYLERAQEANPGLQAFAARYEAARTRVPQAAALPDPMLQVTHFVESVQTRTGPQENVIMLSQRIPWFGTLDSRASAASAQAEAVWYAYQARQLSLAREVSLAYFDYGYTGKAIELTRRNLDLLQKLVPVVEERVRTGGDLNPLLRIRVEVGKLDDQLESLKQKRVVQSARLAHLLALTANDVLPFPEWEAPAPAAFEAPALAAAIERNNPELAMLERQIASAAARKEVARLTGFPDFSIGLNYIQIDDPVVNPNTPDAGQDPWGLTFSINIPLWREKYSASRSEAMAEHRGATDAYADRLNGLRADLNSSLASLADAHRRLRLYGEELLSLARQAVEISRTSYESGRTGLLEVIDSERSLLDLELRYWQAAADAYRQRIIIQTLANQPLLGTFKATTEK